MDPACMLRPFFLRSSQVVCRATARRHLSTRRPPQRKRGHASKPPTPPGNSAPKSSDEPSRVDAVSNALSNTAAGKESGLIAPVHIPADPHAILKDDHPSVAILSNSSIVVQRQLEMMNVMLGFEQANKYVIMDPQGNHIGYLAEQEHGLGKTVARQVFRTSRSFTTHVFDRNEKEVLRFHRPFSWISSRIRVHDALEQGSSVPYSSSTALQGTSATSLTNNTSAQISQLPLSQMRIIGEAQQQWAPLRRKYNLFLYRDAESLDSPSGAPQLTSGDLPLSDSTALQPVESASQQGSFAQFAYVNEPLLSWDFSLRSADNRLIGSVNRNFAGFAREIFTDTGVYALRMDSAGLAPEPENIIPQTDASGQRVPTDAPGMTLDQRAVMLATAVSIDFDYFSRHSHAGGGGLGFMPIWFPGAGGGASPEAAEGAGAAEDAAGGSDDRASRDAAGLSASVDTLPDDRYGSPGGLDDASPMGRGPSPSDPAAGQGQPGGNGEDVWGEVFDWGGKEEQSQGGGDGGDGDGDGGGWGDSFF